MGFDPVSIAIIGTVLSSVVGVAGGIASANATSRAADEQKEANNISAAQNKVDSLEQRRAKVREERIRRAMVISSSENSGTSGSSGEIGSIGALNTNLAGLVSTSLGQSRANNGINNRQQSAADFTSKANAIGAWTNTIQGGIEGFSSVFDKK